MQIERPVNPEAVLASDQFIIAKKTSKGWLAIESWQAKFIAQHYAKVLRAYEPGTFRVFAADKVTLVSALRA